MKAKKYSVFLMVLLTALLCMSPIVFGQEVEQSDGAIVMTGENESEIVSPQLVPNDENKEQEDLEDVNLKVQSSSTFTEGDWDYFILDDGTVETWEYHGNVPEQLIIPSSLGGKKVTLVGYVFHGSKDNAKKVKSIIVPEGVTMLDSLAFNACTNLESVQLPSTLKVIRNSAFADCPSLKYLDIPYNVELISKGAVSDIPNVHFNRQMIQLGDNGRGTRIVDHHVNVKAIMDYDAAKKMMELTNQERAKVGRKRLKYSAKATEFAMLRAVECLMFFDHSSPSSPYEMLTTSYTNMGGENITGSNGLLAGAEKAIQNFINSKGHYNQMIDPNHYEIGCGFAYSTNASTMGSSATQDFSYTYNSITASKF